jgi:hypothetical protein
MSLSDPQVEQETLHLAISVLQECWGQPGMAHALRVLGAAVEQTEQALPALAAQASARDTAFRMHVRRLSWLLVCGQTALHRAAASIHERARATADAETPGWDTHVAVGTILSGPRCGTGLYTVVRQATTTDLVLDVGRFLRPQHTTIPPRETGCSLACPVCDAWLLKNGQRHTLQHGWQSRGLLLPGIVRSRLLLWCPPIPSARRSSLTSRVSASPC